MSSSETPTFFGQLKRRRVIRVAIAYAAAAFVVLQVADLVFPALGVSDAVYRVLVIVSLAGFPVALVLAWLFDLTPEGVRRATPEGESGPLVARYRPLLLVGGGVAALIAAVAMVTVWARPRPAAGAVAAGADVVAVLPFVTRGEGVEVLGEGMVDLLSRNLDEVGAIRTVEPRVVLYRWSQAVEDGVVTLGQALELGREVEAGSILWGSVTAVGANVRIAGDLHTVDGTRLASVEKDGSSDNVLAVVDSFSVALLREVWRSQEPVPQFNVAAITTVDPQAIRAYLQGERFYRSSSWDSAEVAFGRAVEADSTFALAHYRLVRIAGWSGSRHMARQEAELALRYAERLPARERTLVLAEYLRSNRRDVEALDTLRAYLERYPDDPEALFRVVDDAYHERLEQGGIDRVLQPTAEAVRPFDRVIQLDPTFTPSLIHPLERSLAARDTALFGQYIALLEAAVPAETLAIRTYRTAFRALCQPEDTETLLEALELALRRDHAQDLRWQARLAALDPLTRALIGLPAEKRRPAVDWLLSELAGEAASQRHAVMVLQVLIAAGRLREAGDLLVMPSVRSAMSESDYETFRRMPSDLGYVDGETHDGVFAQHRGRDGLLRSRLLAALDRGDGEAIRRSAAEAREHGQAVGAPIWEALADAADGFVAALAGDAASGLARVEDVLGVNNLQTGPFWFRWAEWLGRYPETRARGIALLSAVWDGPGTYWPGSGIYDVPRLFALGQALEADGELAGAREAYERFVAILAAADAGLLVHEKVDSARAALARLPR